MAAHGRLTAMEGIGCLCPPPPKVFPWLQAVSACFWSPLCLLANLLGPCGPDPGKSITALRNPSPDCGFTPYFLYPRFRPHLHVPVSKDHGSRPGLAMPVPHSLAFLLLILELLGKMENPPLPSLLLVSRDCRAPAPAHKTVPIPPPAPPSTRSSPGHPEMGRAHHPEG